MIHVRTPYLPTADNPNLVSSVMEVNQIELGLAMSNNNSNSTNISSKPTIPAEIPPISELTKPYLLPKESPFHVPPHVVMARLDDEVKELQAHVREVRFI